MKLPGRVLGIVQDISKLAKHTAINWVNINNTDDQHTVFPLKKKSFQISRKMLSVLIIIIILKLMGIIREEEAFY